MRYVELRKKNIIPNTLIKRNIQQISFVIAFSNFRKTNKNYIIIIFIVLIC